jgi:tRNA(Ile)-lysidine synthase
MVNLGVVEQLLNHINRCALCKTTDKILLAVSGGVDSMVMFHLLARAGFKIAVAHCNFQLRGGESTADEELVKDACDQAGVPFYVKRFDTQNYASAHGISIQMAARELRYDFFRELLETHGLQYAATAHHLNDNIESILLNFVRGTGIDGMAGIAPKKDRIIRPMLFATRSAIVNYALAEKVMWREDSSNATDDYQRNFLRHQVIPKFQEINPAFVETFRDTQERLMGAAYFKQFYVKEFASSAVDVVRDKTTVDIRKIHASETPAVLLWELVKQHGFNYDQCRQISMDHQPGKIFYSQSHQLLVDRTQYFIEKKQLSDFVTQTIEKGQRTAGRPPLVLTLKEILRSDFRMVNDSSLAQLDADRLKFPLVWRKWQAGDYFTPLGMRQEKKLSDFLIDLKIPFNAKADITVVESGGDIIWVVGYRISEHYKVTEDTQRILVLEGSESAEIKNIS